jgi:hypothetical protein
VAAGEGGELSGGGSGGAIIFCRGGKFCDRASSPTFSIQNKDSTYVGIGTVIRTKNFV